MADSRAPIEARIRAACDEGDYDAATTISVQAYGPEILGFLVARLRDESRGSEVFSLFCSDLWRGFPDFQWRCTTRVWAYTLARHAANRWASAAHRKPERNIPLSQAGAYHGAAEGVRQTTLPHLRSEVKSRVTQLREQLPLEDQTVLILRVDKQMSWRELAEVMLDEGESADEATLKREASRLRKRFQLAKGRLRKLAQAEGLLRPDSA